MYLLRYRKKALKKDMLFGLSFIAILSLLFNLLPNSAYAHAYSSSFTEFNFTDEKTEFNFSIDSLSILELREEIDKNKNGILEMSELKKDKHHIEELIDDTLAVDKNNEQQEPELKEMIIEKKENKEYVTFKFTFPAFYPGETISFTDGFYTNNNSANYIDLLAANNRGETSQAILQGDDRTWTILLTENQQEQGISGDGSTEQQQTPQPNTNQNNHVNTTKSSWFSFFKLGMFHILTGYDHLLFLFALLLRKQTFKQYAAIITSFTIAHSITLSLAALGVVDLPSRFIESAIAFSIVYVAAENLLRKEIRHRWGLTFVFGLIHGFGFANLLNEMNITKTQLVGSLLSFNVGIEFVQLLVVILLLPILIFIQKLPYSKKIIQYGSIVIILLGGFWLFERVFA